VGAKALVDEDGDELFSDQELYHGTLDTQEDTDADGYSDYLEILAGSKPLLPLNMPSDYDLDEIPDVLDLDDDNDGYSDDVDAFPYNSAEAQDTDLDLIGNNSDLDDDNDGYSDIDELAAGTDPLITESIPEDNDKDFISNATDHDDDNDGFEDSIDALPYDASEHLDSDGDNIGNSIDTDDDDDGVEDYLDSFPLDSMESVDTDSDGIGNNADTDDDDDGYTDVDELANGTDSILTSSIPADNDGDFISDLTDTDDDNDGVEDSEDAYPFDPKKSEMTRIALNIYAPKNVYGTGVGETVTIPVMYQSSDDSLIDALSFKLYFNSQLLQWNETTILISTGLLGGMDRVYEDAANGDDDALTDSYLQVAWFDFSDSSNLPGESGEIKLFDIEFSLLQDLGTDTTALSIVGDDAGISTGYKVISVPINIAMNSNSFTLDINGDGKVSLPIDGFIILRSMVGFPASALASNDDMLEASRTRDEMADLLNNAKTDLSLDINGDGKVSLPIDGFIILRHMVGFPASALASDEDMVGATRTRDEMKSYLTGSQ
jgi:hypothetical protein